jgi:hypothetical protein
MGLVELFAGLALEVAKYANNAKVNERANTIKDLKEKIMAEKSRGQQSDDGVIEGLEQQLAIEGEALLVFLATAGASHA